MDDAIELPEVHRDGTRTDHNEHDSTFAHRARSLKETAGVRSKNTLERELASGGFHPPDESSPLPRPSGSMAENGHILEVETLAMVGRDCTSPQIGPVGTVAVQWALPSFCPSLSQFPNKGSTLFFGDLSSPELRLPKSV